MSESGNVKVNQPNFLVKELETCSTWLGSSLLSYEILKQLKRRLFNFFSSQFYTLITSRRGLKPFQATNPVQAFIRVPALTRTAMRVF